MAATTTEPVKARKPPKLFSVTGDEGGIKTELSNHATDKLLAAVDVLRMLAQAESHFPKAKALCVGLHDFTADPTAKPESKA